MMKKKVAIQGIHGSYHEIDHGFSKPGRKISFEENGKTYSLRKYSELYFQSMLNWLEKIY